MFDILRIMNICPKDYKDEVYILFAAACGGNGIMWDLESLGFPIALDLRDADLGPRAPLNSPFAARKGSD